MHRDRREGSGSSSGGGGGDYGTPSSSARPALMADESAPLSGAEYLASIFGTERDKVNCSFYFKIGACRHGDKCSRMHNRPTYSQTLLMKNLYRNPMLDARQADVNFNSKEDGALEQEHFDDFFEEVFVEIEDCYGEIEEMNVCDNIGEHMIGNVYVKFRREQDAERALNGVSSRWFAGAPVYAELSPVTDFREACCRQYESGECTRGGFCNFMHLKPISHQLRRELYNRNHVWRTKKRKRRKQKARQLSKSPSLAGSSRSRTSINDALPQAYQCAESSSSSSSSDSASDSDSQPSKRQRRQRISSDSSNVPAAFRPDRFESSSSDSDSNGSSETDADTPSSLKSSQRTHRSLTSPLSRLTKTPSPSRHCRTATTIDMKRSRKERWKALNCRLKEMNNDMHNAMNGSLLIDDESERSFVFSLL